MALRPARSIDDYQRDPLGRYVRGPSWLRFRASATLQGWAVWGSPSAADVKDLVRSYEGDLASARFPGSATLVDARRLSRVEPDAFQVMQAYVRDEQHRLARAVSRYAVVRADASVPAAVAAGFFAVQPTAQPVRVFTHLRDALVWLEEFSPALLRELDALEGDTAASPALGAVRDALAAHLVDASLSVVAQALGWSERTLQRRLGEAATTFQQELLRARLREAEHLLAETALPVAEVAARVGMGSAAHFSTAFRAHAGLAPTDWRARRRED